MRVSQRKPAQLDVKFNVFGIMGHKIFSWDCIWAIQTLFYTMFMFLQGTFNGPDAAKNMHGVLTSHNFMHMKF